MKLNSQYKNEGIESEEILVLHLCLLYLIRNLQVAFYLIFFNQLKRKDFFLKWLQFESQVDLDYLFTYKSYSDTLFYSLQMKLNLWISEIAPMWKEASKLIKKAGETRELLFLKQASEILLELSNKEYEAMNQLSIIS